MSRTYRFVSWGEVDKACLSMYCKMREDGYNPQSLIGLLRGGVVPARIFSDLFGIFFDFYALDVTLYDGIGSRKERPHIKEFYGDVDGKSVLVVDDIWDSGVTMNAVLDYLKGQDVVTATLFWKETAKQKPHYYAEEVKEEEWIVFPWETCEFRREIENG